MKMINSGNRSIFTDVFSLPRTSLRLSRPWTSISWMRRIRFLRYYRKYTNFEPETPTVFIAEVLIMCLGAFGKLKLLKAVSSFAAPGSIFLLQFMDRFRN